MPKHHFCPGSSVLKVVVEEGKGGGCPIHVASTPTWSTPPFACPFYAYRLLQHKVKVAERLSSWTGDSKCPVCRCLETNHHAPFQTLH